MSTPTFFLIWPSLSSPQPWAALLLYLFVYPSHPPFPVIPPHIPAHMLKAREACTRCSILFSVTHPQTHTQRHARLSLKSDSYKLQSSTVKKMEEDQRFAALAWHPNTLSKVCASQWTLPPITQQWLQRIVYFLELCRPTSLLRMERLNILGVYSLSDWGRQQPEFSHVYEEGEVGNYEDTPTSISSWHRPTPSMIPAQYLAYVLCQQYPRCSRQVSGAIDRMLSYMTSTRVNRTRGGPVTAAEEQESGAQCHPVLATPLVVARLRDQLRPLQQTLSSNPPYIECQHCHHHGHHPTEQRMSLRSNVADLVNSAVTPR